ncbi:P-selectin glycoprotein ligand 1 isoform X3 [Leopardus geoffroyi]|uniref:P-selectin glycoprotein ligand 1 isoform X3 n=1 Tax=Leopardus geoffroyi TaxID=46844 RepID=UPI001E261F38|nr:P-selectin glycoprotein ligand 1 isoform X3 [Leopardus geoffroyi]
MQPWCARRGQMSESGWRNKIRMSCPDGLCHLAPQRSYRLELKGPPVHLEMTLEGMTASYLQTSGRPLKVGRVWDHSPGCHSSALAVWARSPSLRQRSGFSLAHEAAVPCSAEQGAMPLQVLLLLILLGSDSSLQLRETWENGTIEAPDPLLVQGQKQVEEDPEQDMYDYIGTDPPETLFTNRPGPVFLTWTFLAETATGLGQKDSGTPEQATLVIARGDSVGLDARGMATGDLSMEVATQGVPVTLGPLSKEQVTVLLPITEASSTEGAPSTELATTEALSTEPAATEAQTTQPAATEAPSTGPAATEALTTQPAATEAPSTGPAATEALTTQSAATEAPSTGPAATEALTTQPAATEAPSTGPAATEALTTQSVATEAPSTGPAATEAQTTQTAATEAPSTGPEATDALSTSMEPTATEALSTDPATTKVPSTGPATTRSLTMALFVPSDPYNSTTVAVGNSSDGFIKQWKNNQNLAPQSSVAPSPTEALDRIPVKQCLLAILVLALVATIFLVCTVVLAVRLSRKNHMYPVRNYSPTEMVCISSLLPEGGEAPSATANGDLPNAKSQGLKAGPREGRDGDDLTLQSFLP